MNKKEELEKKLQGSNTETRLEALQELSDLIKKEELSRPRVRKNQVNNHIHTTFSFSPYSPTGAVWRAFRAGLATAGIMDHDSISGAPEFIRAGKILDFPVTIGLECRVDFSDTSLAGHRLNHPDQKSTAYMALHGVPHHKIETVQEFFTPYRRARKERSGRMTERLNDYFGEYDVDLDFEKDILPLSEYENGGTVTERHLLYAVSERLIESLGKGEGLLSELEDKFGHLLSPQLRSYLEDEKNPYYKYDLLGLLKKDTSYFYIPAQKECPPVKSVIELSETAGAIPSYAYLGDIEKSVTGDKKKQKFEDDYLPQLLDVLLELGFKAVAYMPTRNTKQQLTRLKKLCVKRDLFQISGEDINSPRQSFVCDKLEDEEFSNLIDSTWALIGHEKMASRSIENGMFAPRTVKRYPDLEKRIQIYSELGSMGWDY